MARLTRTISSPRAANSRRRPAIAPAGSRIAEPIIPRREWSAKASPLVRATQLERVGEGGGTESEDITVHRIPRTELKRFLDGKRGEGCGIDVRLLMLLGQDIISGERQ